MSYEAVSAFTKKNKIIAANLRDERKDHCG
jgi:hypothetical protein